MGLQIRSKDKGGLRKLVAASMMVFALVLQPMYGLVASTVANAATAVVETESELRLAATDYSKDVIELGSNITLTSQLGISRSVTLDGAGHTLSAQWAGGSNNDSAISITGVGNPMIRNIVVDGIGATETQGIQVWRSTATLVDVTVRNNQKAGLHVNGSTVQVTNITTSNNSRGKSTLGVGHFGGILVSNSPAGSSTFYGELNIDGASTHTNENNHIRLNSGTVNDNSSQYQSSSIIVATRYTLKSPPLAPTITAPGNNSEATSSTVNVTWNAVAGTTSRQAADSYEYRLNGGISGTTSDLNHSLTGLTDGNYTFEVRSVAKSGVVSAWSVVSFSVELPDATKPSVTINTNTDQTNGSSGTHPYYSRISFKLFDAGSNLKEVTINGHPYSRSGKWADLNWVNINKNHLVQGQNVVIAYDAVGNESNPVEFTYDSLRPIANITSPGFDGAVVGPNATIVGAVDPSEANIKTHWFEITYPDNTLGYVNKPANGELSHQFTLDTSKGSGTYKIRYVATDKAGNRNDDPNYSNSMIRTFIVDTNKPTIHIKGKNGLYADPASLGDFDADIYREVSFKFYDSHNIDKYEINGVTVDLGNAPWSDANYANIKSKLNQGSNTIVLYDAAGNTTEQTFTYDSIAPGATFTYSNNGTEWVNSAVTVTMTTTESVQAPEGWTKVSDTVFTKKFNTNFVGSVIISDRAGNTSTPLGFEVKRIDSVNPILNIADGAVKTSSTVELVATEENIAYIKVDEENVPYASNGSTHTFTVSGEGSHAVVVADKADNKVSINFTIDTTAPAVEIVGYSDNLEGVPVLYGTVDDSDAIVTVTINGEEYTVEPYTTQFEGESITVWLIIFDEPLPAGRYVVTAKAKDTAGNETAEADIARYNFTLVADPIEEINPIERYTPSRQNVPRPDDRRNQQAVEQALAINNEATSTSNDEDEGDVLGAETNREEGTPASTLAAVPTTKGWEIAGLLWYWWLLILAAVAGFWWIIAAARRRRKDQEA